MNNGLLTAIRVALDRYLHFTKNGQDEQANGAWDVYEHILAELEKVIGPEVARQIHNQLCEEKGVQ